MLPEHFGRLPPMPNLSPEEFRSPTSTGQCVAGRPALFRRMRVPRWSPLRLLSVLMVAAELALRATEASASGRVALVMVCENYQKLPQSTLGRKRGNDIADALAAHGFEVVFSANPSNSAARAALRDFSAKISGSDLAIVILIGHGSAWRGQSFFLPSNSEIRRASDLLSRGLSVTNIAQIVRRATNGGVFFLMTRPNFGAAIEALDNGPQFTAEIDKNVFAAFSSSASVPASSVDSTSRQAADALTGMLRQSAPRLNEAVRAAVNGDAGMVVGTVPDLILSALEPNSDRDDKAEVEAKLDAERATREMAEKRFREQQAKTDQAQTELQKLQAESRRAQAEADQTQADLRNKLGIEQMAREAAETRAREQQAKAEQVQTDLQKSQADNRRTQADADKSQTDTRKAQADADKALVDLRTAQSDAEKKLADERVAREMAEKLLREQQARVDEGQTEVRRTLGDVEAKLAAERVGRAAAEQQARDQQAKADQTQAELLKAQAQARKAQTDAERNVAAARKAQTDAESRLDAERTARDAAEKRAREQEVRADQAQADLLKAQAFAHSAQAEAEKARSNDKQAEDPRPRPILPVESPKPPGSIEARGADHFVTGLDPTGDNWLALKAAPSLRANRIMKMPPGTPLKVLRREGGWFNIRLQDGTEGWAEAQYIGCCRTLPPTE